MQKSYAETIKLTTLETYRLRGNLKKESLYKNSVAVLRKYSLFNSVFKLGIYHEHIRWCHDKVFVYAHFTTQAAHNIVGYIGKISCVKNLSILWRSGLSLVWRNTASS